MRKRTLAVIVLAAMVISLLGGCGSSGAGTAQTEGASGEDAIKTYLETGEITTEKVQMRWLHRFPTADEAEYFQQIADEYTKMHPNVTFKIDTAGDDAMKEKLRVMMGGGDVPDIFYSWSGEFAAKFVRAGVALDLTPYQEADAEWKNSISQVRKISWYYTALHRR